MGSREWVAVSSQAIDAGSEAIVVAVEGNALRVTKL
jgi:membrane protein implicated in regulation of membrane protease activity